MARFGVVITSDQVYRGEREDQVSPLVDKMLSQSGHQLVYKSVVPNDVRSIIDRVREACTNADIVLVTGGTGISPRDVTVDAVASIAERVVHGFGELHRRLSYKEIGSRSILSRSTAYIIEDTCFVAVTPGNPSAARIALEILLPLADHIVEQLQGLPHH